MLQLEHISGKTLLQHIVYSAHIIMLQHISSSNSVEITNKIKNKLFNSTYNSIYLLIYYPYPILRRGSISLTISFVIEKHL